MRRTLMGLVLAAAALTAGCSGSSHTHAAPAMTEAQRDSAIARSSLPGAFVVGRALAVSGREENHAAQLDSLGR